MNNNSCSHSSSSSGMASPPQLVPQNLPLGWRFLPNDQELVGYYLKRKRLGDPIYGLDIGEVQVCDYDPRDLPALSMNKSRDKVWYFFCPRLYHNNRGLSKRKAKGGSWKCTGDLRSVTLEDTDEEIGTKRTLVFHNPKPTQWVIHEYEYTAALNAPIKGNYVLCKLKISDTKKKAAKKAEPDCKKTRPNKKARKSESNIYLASTSTSENKKLEEMTTNSACGEGETCSHMTLDLENQNLNKMASTSTCNDGEMSSLIASNFENGFYKRATVSTCNKGEASCPTASDLGNHNPNEMTAMSSYKKVKPSCSKASGLENLSTNEIASLSTNNNGETNFFRTSDIENQNSNVFEKGKTVNLVFLDFEKQNPIKNMDIPASTEGEQSHPLETPLDFEYQNQFRKMDMSLNEGNWFPSMTSIVGETTSQEVQSMPIPEDCLGSAMTSFVKEAMFQVQSQYKNAAMPIPKDNGVPFTASDVEAQFPVIEMTSIVGETTSQEVQSMPIPEDFLGSAMTPFVKEAMFQVQSQYKNAAMPIPKDNGAPFTASYVEAQFPAIEMTSIVGETTSQEVQSMPIPEDFLGSAMTPFVKEAMFQVQSQYKNAAMPIPKDNGAPFTASDVEAQFPAIDPQLLEEILAFFELEESLNSLPEQPISDKERPGSN